MADLLIERDPFITMGLPSPNPLKHEDLRLTYISILEYNTASIQSTNS